jgi:FAD/FMN-containing dehydrogenase
MPRGTIEDLLFHRFCFPASEQSAAGLAPFAQSELGTKCLVKWSINPSILQGSTALLQPQGSSGALRALRGGQCPDSQGVNCRPSRSIFSLHPPGIPISWPHSTCRKTRPDSVSHGISTATWVVTIWDSEADDERVFTWLDGTLPLMDPFAEGHYVNEVEGRRHPDRYRLSYSEANWQRLRHMRQQFDPAGVFQDYLGSS